MKTIFGRRFEISLGQGGFKLFNDLEAFLEFIEYAEFELNSPFESLWNSFILTFYYYLNLLIKILNTTIIKSKEI